MATGAQILSVPFRLNQDGTVATVTQNSDQANGEQIGVVVSTIQLEREMAPGFGIPDPAFSGIETASVAAQVALYGPTTTIQSVTAAYGQAPNEVDVTVSFT
jgi:hypothetical protein